MKIFGLFMIVTLFFTCLRCHLEKSSKIQQIIRKYLLIKGTKFCVLLTCWNKHDNIKVSKVLSDNNIRTVITGHQNYIEHLRRGVTYNATFVLDYSCQYSYEVLEESGNYEQLSFLQKWLILMEPKDGMKIFLKESLKNIKFRWDSDVKVLENYGNNTDNVSIYDIYNPSHHRGGKIVINIVGHCNFSTGEIFLDTISSLYKIRKNLSGLILSTATVIIGELGNKSYEEYLTDTKTGTQDVVSKYHYNTCNHLAYIHSFNKTLIVTNSYWGHFPNGTDSGLSYYIYHRFADFSCVANVINPERIGYVRYLSPQYEFRTCFIFRNPGHHDPFEDQFLKPFTNKVWNSCLICIALYIVSFRCIFWLEHTFMGVKQRYTWVTAMFITTVAFFQKGSSTQPSHLAGKTVYFSLLIMTTVIYNYYTSSIVSILLNSKPIPIKTLTALGKSTMKLSMEDVPYIKIFLNDPDFEEAKPIFEKKVKIYSEKPNFDSLTEGVEKIKKGGHGYHVEAISVYALIENSFHMNAICELEEIDVIGSAPIAMITQKNSQHHYFFKTSLRMLETSGIVKRDTSVIVARKPICLNRDRFVSVEIEEVFTAFLVYFALICLSLLLLIIEITWSKESKVSHPRRLSFRN